MKNFKTFGVMLDVSRNAVKTVEDLKKFLPLIRKMGYNAVFLYMEDNYEVEGEPYFGYMRGRYSISELREIDEFCASIGMEAIPCIQTLAHLKTHAKWGKVPYENESILLVGEERVYELIDHMFATLSKCFRTKNIHVGMDEAHALGRLKYLDKNGYEPKIKVMKKHLARVNEIAEKYGYENPMIWSDMLFYGWNNGNYVVPKQDVPEEYKKALPDNVIPVFWDYYHCKKQEYGDMLEMHAQISNRTWFAGGVYTWCGLIPDNGYTIRSMVPAIDACRENKIKNVFMTLWGNNGGECSFYSVLPSLCYLAEYAKGNTDMEKIKKRFNSIVGLDYDECIRIDCGNYIAGNEDKVSNHARNPSKYMLYADTLNDFLDWTVKPGMSYKFADVAKDMHALAKKSRKFGYVYKAAACLCDVMEIKYELGIKTRAAYEAGDKDELRRLANEDYAEVIKRVDVYGKAHEIQWRKENKLSGLESIDLRVGGVIRRMQTVRKYILDYCDGKVDSIEPLDQELLPYMAKEQSYIFFSIAASMSANYFS